MEPELTIVYEGIPMRLNYDYQPEEKQTWDYPGCPEAITVYAVEIGDKESHELDFDDLSGTAQRRIEELGIEAYHDFFRPY
jgi:hypothetical protein